MSYANAIGLTRLQRCRSSGELH